MIPCIKISLKCFKVPGWKILGKHMPEVPEFESSTAHQFPGTKASLWNNHSIYLLMYHSWLSHYRGRGNTFACVPVHVRGKWNNSRLGWRWWVVPLSNSGKKANLRVDSNCSHQVCDLGHISLSLGFLLCKMRIKTVLIPGCFEDWIGKVLSTWQHLTCYLIYDYYHWVSRWELKEGSFKADDRFWGPGAFLDALMLGIETQPLQLAKRSPSFQLHLVPPVDPHGFSASESNSKKTSSLQFLVLG